MSHDPSDAGRGDELVCATSREGGIAVRCLVGTQLVAEAARRHRGSAACNAALGRALMGAVLLAADGERGETIQLQFRGDGPLGTIVAISDAEGRVRGYASCPSAQSAPVDGALDVGAAVGKGLLAVVRQRADACTPQRGLVPLVTGTIAQDLAYYLTESEQTRSAVALGVYFSPRATVEAAGGFTVCALPGASEREVERAEANVRDLSGPGELVRAGVDADAMASRLLANLGSRRRRRSRPVFHCRCDRERVLHAIGLLGREELDRAVREAEPLEIHCHFCAETYRIAPDEISDLLGAA